MQNSSYNPAINRINTELDKLNSIVQNTKSQNSHFLQILKNCYLSTPSSSSSIIFDDLPGHSQVKQIFDQAISKNVSSIHSNNLSDTLTKNQSLLLEKSNKKNKTKGKNNPFKKCLSGTKFQSQKNQSNQKSTFQPSKQTIKKGKFIKSSMGKTKKQITNKCININKSNQYEKRIILQSQKKTIDFKSQPKQKLKLDFKKQKVLKIRKITRKRQKDEPYLFQSKIRLPTKTQQSIIEQDLKSHRVHREKYSSVPPKQRDFQNITTYRKSGNKFHIDLEKQVENKITDLKLNQKFFQLQKIYFLSSIKITKKQLLMVQNATDKTQDIYQLLKSMIDTIKQIICSIIFSDKQKKNSLYQTLSKHQYFLKSINQFPQTLKSLSCNSEQILKKSLQKMKQIKEKINKLHNKTVSKNQIYIYFCALYKYLDFFIKNKPLKTIKKGKSHWDKNSQLLSCRIAQNSKQKVKRIIQIKPSTNKKRQPSERKKQEIRALKRVSTVKILGKNKS